jgi:hypothetical protein
MSNLDLDFTTREQYLTWRAEWRKQYRELSNSIREKKAKRNANFRNGDSAAVLQSIILRQKIAAFELMELHTESKKLAGMQYHERAA